MELVRWNPWRDMEVFSDRFSRLLAGAFPPAAAGREKSPLSDWRPVVDIFEQEDKFVIKAELPGVKKDDIHIDLKDRVLTLSGERTHESEVKEGNYYRKERACGTFHRAFELPADLDAEKIKADYKGGVLNVEIPKPEEHKPRKITVH